MPDITMPKLSDTMEEGKILRWLKEAGEQVSAGEILVEVETDKADMEIEAEQGGVLREIRLQEGDTAPVGAVIAVIDTGDVESRAASAPSKRASDAPKEQPAARREAPRQEPSKEAKKETQDEARHEARAEARSAARDAREERREDEGSESVAEAADVPVEGTKADAERTNGSAPPPPRAGARVSPLARTRAAELGIDPTSIRGTGPAGRVTRKDVEDASRAASAPGELGATEKARTAPAPEPRPRTGSGTVRVRPVDRAAPPVAREPASAPEAAQGDVRRIPLSGMRASIARRMSESKREAPHFYVTAVADMDMAVRFRAALKEGGEAAAGVTYNHLVLKACADALAAIPEMNARFAGDAIEVLPEVNLGVATAVPEGLIVPVIHAADRLSLFEIAARARELGERARKRSFTREDLSGATFSVSNLGMYDVESFIAVINPPQAGILAVGSVQEVPVVRDGQIRPGHTLHLTVSCDHRAVDGVRAAEFLADLRRRLENPMLLVIPTGEA
ncbi:MAG: 2-oxo acid dehydrogenase subunit E2 [Deltaproteobacteria bacterium]|nr:2-oxo acid dehydrogenase subunit E2 [Deltaproteobacteria bacterium]